MTRKDHTLFYFNKEVDQALRECDEERAEVRRKEWERQVRIEYS